MGAAAEYKLSLANAAAASSSAGIIMATDFERGLGEDEDEDVDEVMLSKWSRSNPVLFKTNGLDAVGAGAGEEVRDMDWKVSMDCEDVVDCGEVTPQSDEGRDWASFLVLDKEEEARGLKIGSAINGDSAAVGVDCWCCL